jgi:hypothetical protein
MSKIPYKNHKRDAFMSIENFYHSAIPDQVFANTPKADHLYSQILVVHWRVFEDYVFFKKHISLVLQAKGRLRSSKNCYTTKFSGCTL